MAFPTTVQANPGNPDKPCIPGVFSVGTNLYIVATDASPSLVMYKSTDGGTTWAIVDAGNGPNFANDFSAVLNAGKIYCVYENFDGPNLAVTVFDTAGDTWGVESEGPVFITGSVVPSIVAVFRSDSNDFLVVARLDQFAMGSTPQAYFALFDASLTWTAASPLPVNDYADPTVSYIWQPIGAVSTDGGITQLFFYQISGDVSQDSLMWYLSLTDISPGTLKQVTQGSTLFNTSAPSFTFAYDGTSNTVLFAMCRAGTDPDDVLQTIFTGSGLSEADMTFTIADFDGAIEPAFMADVALFNNAGLTFLVWAYQDDTQQNFLQYIQGVDPPVAIGNYAAPHGFPYPGGLVATIHDTKLLLTFNDVSHALRDYAAPG